MDKAEFHGRFVDFDPIFCWPKPVQWPHPPILVGGGGPTTFDRVVEYGDGWMPVFALGVDEIIEKIPELRRRAEEAGRDPVPVTVYAVPGDREAVERLTEAGVERVLFDLPTLPAEATHRKLDEFAAIAASVEA
jgi:alkanesulfonate monooxygenase SsuD/methylene tetrahydromethanopterin reductase-like flavin-dependent oxidoreductase (luciferase family)